MTARRAEPGDAPELARLRWAFRPDDQPNQGFDAFSRDFETWFAEASASEWWKPAERPDKDAGR